MGTSKTSSNVVNIFAAPAEAFCALEEKPTFLLPLAALLVASCAVVLWYYNVVDLVWLMETSLANAGTEIPADAREQVLERVANTSPMTSGGIAAAVSGFVVLLLLLLAATYYSIVSLVTNDGYKFKHWFSLVCWCSMPVVLAQLASMVNVAAASDPAHLPAEQLNPLTLASLLALDVSGASFALRLLQYLDVTSIWALVLMVLGYRAWTRKSAFSSTLIVTGPLIVIIAISLAFALL